MDKRKSVLNKKSILRPAEEVKCNFLFDIIVKNFDTPKLNTQEKNKININVQFNRKIIEISGNRINVDEFKHGTATEFIVNPQKLRQTLEECGMPFAVKYSGRLLGNGQMLFPESFTESIAEDMSDLIHEDSCTFEKNGEVLGTIYFLCRLIIKCEDKPRGQMDCRQNMGSCISPQDIMFLISESQRCPQPCDPCIGAWEPEEGDERLNLDLLRYGSFKTEALRPAETLIHYPACDAITCELKQMAKECEETMDVILRSTGRQKPPCRNADALRDTCDRPCPYQEEKPQVGVYKAPSLPVNLGHGKTVCITPKVSIGDQTKPDIKPTRFCPVCLANMSWLPKFAACPKCGAKPMPTVEERINLKQLKADQIIMEYLGKPAATVEDYCQSLCDKAVAKKKAKDKGLSECRCTCKYGKICASCRVREQCADYIDKQEMRRRPMEAEEVSETSEDYCVVDERPKDSRPFLSRVFSELRDLYDIKDTVKSAEFEKICQQPRKKSLNVQKPFAKEKKNVSMETKQNEAKNREMIKNKSKKPKRLITPLHKLCARKHRVVSRRHGWNWASSREAREYGWRPGAILKPMKKLMKFFLEYTPEKSPLGICNKELEKAEEKERQLPILNMCKKNGEIFITLRAINTDKVQMKPIIFKVVKSDLAVIMSKIKRKLKDKGFPKCTCHQTLMMCVCREHEEKKHLEYALQKECRRRGMESCVDHLILTDTSESDMEFDFDVTPSAGVARPRVAVKPRMNHSTQTQRGKKELKVEPMYPVKQSFYYSSYDCAAGDRYTGTAFGKPGEVVREDGLFGYRHGGPHGESTHVGNRLKSKVIWGTKPGGPMHGGGRFGQQTIPGGKSFPGAKTKNKSDKAKTIPVRMPKRFYKAAEEAAKAAKEAAEQAKNKKPADMMQYMMKKGAVSVPWNPNANAY